ncbi:Hsp33 family molecular chaperone [Oceanicaulis sp. UBA2681]|uniref:Hsp33 family molecular chaperone n=1 Tax=Oceanicaulis sp. UBA2681 TaxID=1947007 RepID=UPI000EBD6579|nr:Hsp33 family molecular chaperone [Oceanicaulis sp. UBA2681]HCR66116.1 Hsp33 family molecular chaperone [Oceanicaulis sp.]|tara:strand:+ start:1685 stop:2668 length:984 start_codon:yes stop_codon:yes gene_type:complete
MTDMTSTPGPDSLGAGDNIVLTFQLEGLSVRGRFVRLGETMDTMLAAHNYPPSVARLVGECALVAILIGDSLKFDGRLIVQASGPGATGQAVEGNGAVGFVVADFVPGKGVRAYAKYDADRVQALEAQASGPLGPLDLLGKGNFVMTIDPGESMERYQGVTAIEGDTLAASAEHYFAQSEQVPTRLRLAVGQQVMDGGKTVWRAGGALIQKIAADDSRPAEDAEFDHALALFNTIEDDELLDPELTAGRVLYRLFHEDGVRVQAEREVNRYCTCGRARLAKMLARFPADDREHMSKEDGSVEMTCEYCKSEWRFTAEEIDAAAVAND